MRDPYWRRLRPVRTIDGDTLQGVVDLGYYTYVEHRLRLLGVDTPELHSSNPDERIRAQAARDFVDAWLIAHGAEAKDVRWPFRVRSEKADSFGRFLAYIECDGGHSLGDALLDNGLAVPYPHASGGP